MSETKPAWASEGYEGTKREEDRIAQQYGPNRMWMPVGTSKEVIFLDDEPVCFHEHNPKINGDWKNWLTCLQAVSDDGAPCCEILGAKSRYWVGYFTVVDCSKWTDKKGNTYQYEIKLLPAKLKSLKKFQMKKKDRGSLVGCLYKAARSDDKAASIGDEFEFVKDADLTKLYDVANYRGKKMAELYSKAVENEDAMRNLKRTFKLQMGTDGKPLPKLVPFNYYALFEPKSAKDVRMMLAGVKPDERGGEDNEPKGGSASDDIPF